MSNIIEYNITGNWTTQIQLNGSCIAKTDPNIHWSNSPNFGNQIHMVIDITHYTKTAFISKLVIKSAQSQQQPELLTEAFGYLIGKLKDHNIIILNAYLGSENSKLQSVFQDNRFTQTNKSKIWTKNL